MSPIAAMKVFSQIALLVFTGRGSVTFTVGACIGECLASGIEVTGVLAVVWAVVG